VARGAGRKKRGEGMPTLEAGVSRQEWSAVHEINMFFSFWGSKKKRNKFWGSIKT
jgi:hypothetical protein